MAVEPLPHPPKVKGLSPTNTSDTRTQPSGGSMVVARLTHQPKVKGLFPATIADTGELKVFTKISHAGLAWW